MSSDDSQIMNYLVRMVVPMKREFGRRLDVGQFMHDSAYATEVIEEARGSQDPRLREYCTYIEKRLHGARVADSRSLPEGSAAPRAAAGSGPDSVLPGAKPAAAPVAPANATDDELRARVMKKYTSGLR
jgi:hypothetical protein